MKHRSKRSLQRQILLRVAPISTLLMLLLALVAGQRVNRIVSQEIQRRVDSSAVHIAGATQEKLRMVVEAAQAVTQNDVIVNGIIDLEYREAITKPFFRSLRLPGASEQSVTLCDYRGRPLISTGKPTDCQSQSWLRVVMSGRDVITTDGKTLTLAFPVRYSGRAEAIIVAEYSLTDFLASVAGSSSTDVAAFGYSGNVVASSNADLLDVGQSLAAPTGWMSASADETGIPNVYAAVIESRSISRQATQTVTAALLTIGAIVALGAVACTWIISRMATRPMLELLKQIERVQTTKDLSTRVSVSGADEFVFLGNRFNSMLVELEQSTVSIERFRSSQQQLEVALNGGEVGLWDWDTKTDQVYYSAILKRQLGYPEDASWNQLSDFESRLHPDDHEAVMATVQEYLFQRTAEYQATFRLRCQDGTYRWILSKGVGEFDEQGEAERLTGVHIDVTERVSHAESLAELNSELERRATLLQLATDKTRLSEERLSLAVHGTSDGLWDWNVETNEMWFSPRYKELLGLDRSDSFPEVLESFADRLHPEDKAATWAAVEDHFDRDLPFDVEFRLLRKAGDYCWFRSRGAATRDEAGIVNRMSGSIQDVTDAKRYHLALEQSNQDLEQFAYVSSHDLQEPLRKVSSFCELLLEEYGEKLDGDGLLYLGYAVDGARRMQTLIRDLLAFSRVRSQGKPLADTCLDESLDAALRNLDVAIDEASATITRDPLPNAWADPRQLTQLFQNLIGNAIKYRSNDEPKIHIGVVEDEETFIISVRDDGIGISPEYHDRIFGVFKRLHGRGEHSGTGIGLAICKQIVDRWRGKIWVESEEDCGSVFNFTVRKTAVGKQDAAQNYAFAD